VRQIQYINIGGKPANLFVRALASVGALIVFGLAIFIGGIVLAGLFGLFLLIALWLYLRVWWLRSRFGNRREQARSTSPGGRPPPRRGSHGSRADGATDFVEAEYQVIDSNAHDDDR